MLFGALMLTYFAFATAGVYPEVSKLRSLSGQYIQPEYTSGYVNRAVLPTYSSALPIPSVSYQPGVDQILNGQYNGLTSYQTITPQYQIPRNVVSGQYNYPTATGIPYPLAPQVSYYQQNKGEYFRPQVDLIQSGYLSADGYHY